MTAWHHLTIASPKKPPGKLRQSSPNPVPPPHRLAPSLRGFFPPFSGANQSLKEANPSLQDFEIKRCSVVSAKNSKLRAVIVLKRHLTPATSLVLNPTTLIRPAATFSRSCGRRAFSPNSVGGEGETLAASHTNQHRDWPNGCRQIKNRPIAVPSPVGRERVRVRAIPFSVPQPTKQNNNTTLKQKYENLLAPRR